MMKLGMHVDNWRHFDVSYHIPCQFAKDHGLEYVEFGTIDGDYFIQALGYSPHIPLHSDPRQLKRYLDSLGLKMSQLDAAYPMSSPEGQYRGIGYTLRAIQFASAVGCPCVDTTDGARKPAGYTDDEVLSMLRAVRPRMQASAVHGARARCDRVYGRAGRPCPRCGATCWPRASGTPPSPWRPSACWWGRCSAAPRRASRSASAVPAACTPPTSSGERPGRWRPRCSWSRWPGWRRLPCWSPRLRSPR